MQGMNFSCRFCGEADLPRAGIIGQYDLCKCCHTVLTTNSLNPTDVLYDKRQTKYYIRTPVIKPGPGSNLLSYVPLSIFGGSDNGILTRLDFVESCNSNLVKEKDISAYKLTDLTELKDIVNYLKPFERAWCKEIQSDIIMYPTGYAVILCDYENDRVISSYFGGGKYDVYDSTEDDVPPAITVKGVDNLLPEIKKVKGLLDRLYDLFFILSQNAIEEDASVEEDEDEDDDEMDVE